MLSSTFLVIFSDTWSSELQISYDAIAKKKKHSLIRLLVVFSPTEELLVEKVGPVFFKLQSFSILNIDRQRHADIVDVY